MDRQGGKDVHHGSEVLRHLPVRWPGAGWLRRRAERGHRPPPAAHATSEKKQQPGSGFGRQRVAEDGPAQSLVLRDERG